jgi:hypothetical protein
MTMIDSRRSTIQPPEPETWLTTLSSPLPRSWPATAAKPSRPTGTTYGASSSGAADNAIAALGYSCPH